MFLAMLRFFRLESGFMMLPVSVLGYGRRKAPNVFCAVDSQISFGVS